MRLRESLFMLVRMPHVWLAALLTLPPAGCMTGSQKPRPARIIPIAPGYAATRVNGGIYRHHAILSFRGRQFVSFYDPEGRVTIAFRDLPS